MKSHYAEKLKTVAATLPWNKKPTAEQPEEPERDFISSVQPRRLYMLASEPRTKSQAAQYAFLCTRESLNSGATLFWVESQQNPIRPTPSPSTKVMKNLFRNKNTDDVEFRQRKEVVSKEDLNTIPSLLGVRKVDFVFELDAQVTSPASLITHVENVLARNIICEVVDDSTTRLDAEAWARSITVAHPIYVTAPQSEPDSKHVKVREPKEQKFEVCNEIVKSQGARKNGTVWMTAKEVDAYANRDFEAEKDDVNPNA